MNAYTNRLNKLFIQAVYIRFEKYQSTLLAVFDPDGVSLGRALVSFPALPIQRQQRYSELSCNFKRRNHFPSATVRLNPTSLVT